MDLFEIIIIIWVLPFNQSIYQSIEEFVTRTVVDGSSRIWGAPLSTGRYFDKFVMYFVELTYTVLVETLNPAQSNPVVELISLVLFHSVAALCQGF